MLTLGNANKFSFLSLNRIFRISSGVLLKTIKATIYDEFLNRHNGYELPAYR